MLITVNPDNGKLNPKANKIKLNFSSPVTDIDFSQLQIKEDSIVKPFEKKNLTLNKQKLQAEVDISYPENVDSLFLIIPDSTIKDFLNNYNNGLKERFTVKKKMTMQYFQERSLQRLKTTFSNYWMKSTNLYLH